MATVRIAPVLVLAVLLAGCFAPKKENLAGTYTGTTTCDSSNYDTEFEIIMRDDPKSDFMDAWLNIDTLGTWDLKLLPSVGVLRVFKNDAPTASQDSFVELKTMGKTLSGRFTYARYENEYSTENAATMQCEIKMKKLEE